MIKSNANSGLPQTEIVELLDDKVNKYRPGTQVFKFVSLTGLQSNSREVKEETIDLSFLMNKDITPFQYDKVQINRSAVIKLKLPKEIARKYPDDKFIPAGTRFYVTFRSGDMSKPVIVGACFEDESD